MKRYRKKPVVIEAILYDGTPFKYCSECGQRIDWSDIE